MSRPKPYNISVYRLVRSILLHYDGKKDHKHGKRSHIYIAQGEKMVFSRILQQNIMIVIKSTHTYTWKYTENCNRITLNILFWYETICFKDVCSKWWNKSLSISIRLNKNNIFLFEVYFKLLRSTVYSYAK